MTVLYKSHKHRFFFGTEPLLDLPWSTEEDDYDFVESIRTHGRLDVADAKLGSGSWHDNHRLMYNPGWHQHGLAHRNAVPSIDETERKISESHAEWERQQAERKERDRKKYAKSKKRAAVEQRMREREEFAQKIKQQLEEEAQRAEEARLEQQRQWALRTSRVERDITLIVDQIDANNDDRMMMRAILRYTSLGPGVGQLWDAWKFVDYYSSSWRGTIREEVHYDAERCRNTLLRYKFGFAS
jgi:hypothetical protein